MIALYPGTFDPVTNGHLDLIQRGCLLCDRLIIGIATSDRKGPLFSAEQRKSLMEEAVAELGLKVEVQIFDRLLVDFARDIGAKMVIRGVRAFSDFEYEFQMALMNRRLAPDHETVFLMPHETYSYVSSRMVKEVLRLGGDISSLVPACVEQAVRARLAELKPFRE